MTNLFWPWIALNNFVLTGQLPLDRNRSESASAFGSIAFSSGRSSRKFHPFTRDQKSQGIAVRTQRWLPWLLRLCFKLLGMRVDAALHTLRRAGLEVTIETEPSGYLEEFGPRFDRTAVVRQVSLQGRRFLGEWGLPDEFGLMGLGVLGYDSTAPGGEFVKIGVGRLIRASDQPYSFGEQYHVSSFFEVKSQSLADGFATEQSTDSQLAWNYRYRKTYRLIADDTLEISYELTNTGATPWSFEHYNHNWFAPDGLAVGPEYSIATGFPLPTGETELVREGQELRIAQVLPVNHYLYLGGDLVRVPATQNHFIFAVRNAPAIRFRGQFTPARFAAYAETGALCPEIFFRDEVPPGQTVRWSAQYQFHPRSLELP